MRLLLNLFSIRSILAVCFTFLLASYLLVPLRDPDLWWHLVIGRWIISHFALPQTDLWNAFSSGHWRAYSWGMEVVMAWAERSAGMTGVYLLQGLLGYLVVVGVFWGLVKLAGDIYVGGLFAGLLVIGLSQYYALRPQALSWVLLLLMLVVSEQLLGRYRTSNPNDNPNDNGVPAGKYVRAEFSGRDWVSLLWLVVLVAIWANTNITTIMSIVIVGAWSLESFGNKQLGRASLIVLAMFVGSLLTPYMGGEWVTAIDMASHPWKHSSINEFQPSFIYHGAFGIAILLCVTNFVVLHEYPALLRISPVRFLLAVGALILAAAVRKFVPHALVINAALLMWSFSWARTQYKLQVKLQAKLKEQLPGQSNCLGHNGRNVGRNVGQADSVADVETNAQEVARCCYVDKRFTYGLILLSELGGKARRPALQWAVLFCLWGVAVNVKYATALGMVDPAYAPVKAMDFVEQNNLPKPLAHTFGDGGYVMHRFANPDGTPRHRVIIDGRTNVNSKEIVTWNNLLIGGDEKWFHFFNNTNSQTILWPNTFPFIVRLLELSPMWCKVYPEDAPDNLADKNVGTSSDKSIDKSKAKKKGGLDYSVFIRRQHLPNFPQFEGSCKRPA